MSAVSWGRRVHAGWAVLVHGGAGAGSVRSSLDEGCHAAAERAALLLRAGAPALDAVEAAVCSLEDDPRYNAGTGANLNEEGQLELDAAIMDGATLRAGAVCALGPYRNPIRVARAVLDDGRHVLLAGAGAARFALAQGFSPADPEQMTTERARRQLAAASAEGASHGTVGAVAIDVRGSVAAATSTGGTGVKRAGRVGDSPILGAGTYADDRSGAISATGHGEGILRVVFAGRLAFELERGVEAEPAARAALELLLARSGTRAGVIVVDRQRRLAWARTTKSMPWAARWAEGESASADSSSHQRPSADPQRSNTSHSSAGGDGDEGNDR